MNNQREISISNPEQLVGFDLDRISYSLDFVDFLFSNQEEYEKGAIARFFGPESLTLKKTDVSLASNEGKLQSFKLIGDQVEKIAIDEYCFSIILNSKETIKCEYRRSVNPRESFVFFPEVDILPSKYFVPIGDIFEFGDIPFDPNLYIPVD